MKFLRIKFLKAIKIILLSLGSIFLILCILAFTSAPFWVRYWLGTHKGEFYYQPDYIVMLGGGGMPGEENLIRLYYTAILAKKHPDSKIIIAYPKDSLTFIRIQNELICKNVDSLRIFFESTGTNTRSQAIQIAKKFPKTLTSNVVIVTSPEHVYRSVLTFQKAGFKIVGSCPTFESSMDFNLLFDDDQLGGRKFIPDVGKNLNLRYNFWTYLKMEVSCIREFAAIGYYWVKGWI